MPEIDTMSETLKKQFIFTVALIKVATGSRGIVGRPLYHHMSNPGSIPRGVHTNRSPYILVLIGQLSFPSFRVR